MTDLRTAAQQALEALETSEPKHGYACKCQGSRHWPHCFWQRHQDTIEALRAAMEQPNECWWFQDGDEDSGTYMASCNQRYFSVVDGTPKDNHMTHCCYCGKPLVEVPIEEDEA